MSRRAALFADPTAGFASPEAAAHHPPPLPLAPEHLALHLRVDIPGRRIAGDATWTVSGQVAGGRSLRLDAIDFEGAHVESADGHALEWWSDGDTISILWAEPVPVGAARRVRVRWDLTDPLTGLHFRGEAPSADAPFFAATDHETERARYWLPCVDHPSARFTTDISLRADARLTALGPGALASRTAHDDGTATTRYTLDRRIPAYLLCVAVGDFVRADGGAHDGKPIAFYAPRPFTAGDLTRTFGPTGGLIAWMEARLQSPLPWPRYDQFAARSIGGAMENVSLVSWDDAWVLDPALHADIGWLVDVINLHELAHTWFGDLLVCRDFSQSWLKESFATFMELAWLASVHGPDVAHGHLLDDLARYSEEAEERYQRPIQTRRFDSSWDLFDLHLYPGGALRLNLLRHTLGDDAFWAGVRLYVARHAERLVESDDLRRAFEEASGRPLTRFFEDWFETAGMPKIELRWSMGEGGGTLVATQLHVDAGRPAFALSLPVRVETTDGEWRSEVLVLDGRSASLRVPLKARPRQIVVDPEGTVPGPVLFPTSTDLLARQALAGPTVVARVRAVQDLCRNGSAAALRAVEQALHAEPAWMARRHFARALGQANTPAAARILARALLAEPDPRALTAFADAAGRSRDPVLAAALCAFLDSGRGSARTRQFAYASLGAQRDPALFPRLRAAALDDAGWWGWEQRGAVQALGEVDHPGALPLLSELLLAPATRECVRAAAAEAIGAAVRWAEPAARARALSLLEDTLKHPLYLVRMAAARALARAGAPASAFTPLRPRVSVQDRPTLNRLVARAAAAGPGDAALRRQVEALDATVRSLKDKLDTLESRQDT
jgi:aminopeptidase N